MKEKQIEPKGVGQSKARSLEEHLYVYAVNKKDGAMALAEIWTFEMTLDAYKVSADENNSSNSSTRKPSFSSSQSLGVQVDQNWFKVDPAKYRQDQIQKFSGDLNPLAQDMPLSRMVPNNSETNLEIRWEKTKDWRFPKVLRAKEQSSGYHEVGKLTVKVEFISEVDIKVHLGQDSEELKANLNKKLQQNSRFGGIFASLAAGGQKPNEDIPRRDRVYSDNPPQTQSRFQNFFSREETKT